MSAVTQHTDPTERSDRAKSLVAKIRDRQLRLARSGKVLESATYAQRARRVKRAACAEIL